MKAIILNSGIGKRMGLFTYDMPKCLIKITREDSILSRQLKLLIENRITEFIITTGPFKEKVETVVLTDFLNLKVNFVYNPEYSSTNYIYSLFLIPRELLNDDLLLLHGDMVFEKRILKKLIISNHDNCVLIKNSKILPNKDFKGKIYQNMIIKVGVNVFGIDCFPLMPIYKLSRESFFLWLNEIDKFISKAKRNVYAEDAFNCIAEKIKLRPVYYNEDELCMEIDNEQDLENAINSLKVRD